MLNYWVYRLWNLAVSFCSSWVLLYRKYFPGLFKSCFHFSRYARDEICPSQNQEQYLIWGACDCCLELTSEGLLWLTILHKDRGTPLSTLSFAWSRSSCMLTETLVNNSSIDMLFFIFKFNGALIMGLFSDTRPLGHWMGS